MEKYNIKKIIESYNCLVKEYKKLLAKLNNLNIDSSSLEHNELKGLQGGTKKEYFHLTREEFDYIKSIPKIIENLNTTINEDRVDKALLDSLEEAVNFLSNKVDNFQSSLKLKVDKENGKGLSQEDFTTVFKKGLEKLIAFDFTTKLDRGNYDGNAEDLKTLIDNNSSAIRTKVTKIPGKDLSTNDFTNHYKSFIDNYTPVDTSDKLDKGNYVGTAENLKSDIDHKVDKVDGKQLSTEDFTTALKQKLEALQNADLTDYVTKTLLEEVKTEVGNLKQILKSNNVNLDTIQEIVDFITLNEATLSSLGIDNIAGLQNALNQKADVNHNHDDRYHKKSEITALLTEKANADHNHDDRYYRKTEVDDNFVKLTDSRLTDSRPASDVYDWAKQPNPPKVSYDDLENLPVKGFIGEYDISKFLDIPYNLSLEEGKYWYLQNGRMNHIQIIKGYEEDSPNSIPVAQYQLHFLHNSTQMPNFRWIIKQSNGTYVFSNGGSWFQFASTHYVSSRAFVHHRVNPTAQQLNDTIGNGIFTIQNYIVPNFPEPETYNGLIINFKGSNIFSQIFYITNGDMWSRGYLNGQWSTWKKLNDYRGLPKTFPFGRKESIGSLSIGNSLLEETNTFFLEGYEQTHKYINFDANIKNYSVISFMKCFNGGEVHFSHPNKTIIKLGADNFNGKKGSTAVVSVVDNEIYIQINNYE